VDIWKNNTMGKDCIKGYSTKANGVVNENAPVGTKVQTPISTPAVLSMRTGFVGAPSAKQAKGTG
jgi:hypothetical protein